MDYDYDKLIKEAEHNAVKGTGLSDVLYEAKVQSAYAGILRNAPPAYKAQVESALRVRGYDPDFVPYVPEPGECRLTGIDIDCCPCGRHP